MTTQMNKFCNDSNLNEILIGILIMEPGQVVPEWNSIYGIMHPSTQIHVVSRQAKIDL